MFTVVFQAGNSGNTRNNKETRAISPSYMNRQRKRRQNSRRASVRHVIVPRKPSDGSSRVALSTSTSHRRPSPATADYRTVLLLAFEIPWEDFFPQDVHPPGVTRRLWGRAGRGQRAVRGRVLIAFAAPDRYCSSVYFFELHQS